MTAMAGILSMPSEAARSASALKSWVSTEILGEKAFACLDDVPGPVDIVDVFRSPDQVLPHAREAIRLKPKVFWMQEGVANREAAELLTAAGIDVVMDRCIKKDHERLFGHIGLPA